jgi:hypothetical protein
LVNSQVRAAETGIAKLGEETVLRQPSKSAAEL